MADEEQGCSLQQPKGKSCLFYFQTVAHSVFLVHHVACQIFGAIFLFSIRNSAIDKVSELFYFSWGYATNWNFLFQTTFLSLALIHDGLEWIDKQDTKFGALVKYWRDVIFAGLVVPITVFVTGMFWSVYAIDRELVFPSVYDGIVPWWFNHCVHTNIFVVVCVETLLQSRRKPADFKMENIFVITVIMAYAVVYYSIYFFSHRWLYQVFAVMTWWQVCLFQSFIWSSSYFFYRIQYPINRLIHRSKDDDTGVKSRNVDVSNEVNNEIRSGDSGYIDNEIDNADESINDVAEKKDQSDHLNDGYFANANNGSFNNRFVNIVNNGDFVDNNAHNGKTTFEKSWSLKYRTQRHQFENSSL